jgi:hypothetical protein
MIQKSISHLSSHWLCQQPGRFRWLLVLIGIHRNNVPAPTQVVITPAILTLPYSCFGAGDFSG